MSGYSPLQIWCGSSVEEVEEFTVDHKILASDIIAAHTGPDIGIQTVDKLPTHLEQNNKTACSIPWTSNNRKAYGLTLSLYDQNPVTKKVSGDPIADCFAFLARKNNAILIVADGVNWGVKSRLAARCAIHGAIHFLQEKIFQRNCPISSTKDALNIMRTAFDAAQNSIIDNNGGLTTLNITMILPIEKSCQYAVCSVNVGDSLAYVFSRRHGVNELSVGSHDINQERDMRDAGGALGPVDGSCPLLVNLTFSVTTCNPGDIVFLTTDGISDNFDPVVTKLAVPGQRDTELCSRDHKAEMLPHERHVFSMKGMERVIHEYELNTEEDVSAEELCTALTEHVEQLTQPKRDVLEQPSLHNRKYKLKERKVIEETIREKLKSLPGKMDHATVVAYEAGIYRGEGGLNTGYYTINNNNCNNNNSNASSSGSNHSNVPDSSSSAIFVSNV